MKDLTDCIKDSFEPHNKTSFAINEYKKRFVRLFW